MKYATPAFLLTALLIISPLLTAHANPVAVGSDHTIAAHSGGNLVAWGANDEGQLGDGTELDGLNPVPVYNERYRAAGGIIAVAAYGNNNLALRDDGTLLGWGPNENGQLGPGVPYAGLYKGDDSDNTDGAVGNDDEISEPSDPALKFATPVVDPEGTPIANVIDMAIGANFAAALRQDGSVVVWGNELGVFADREASRELVNPYFYLFLDPEAESIESPYRDGDPAVTGQLLEMRDAADNLVTGIVAIAVGDDFLIALRGDGTVLGWGENAAGQLADGTLAQRPFPVPVRNAQFAPLDGITSIAAHGSYSLAVRADGQVLGWGSSGLLRPVALPPQPGPKRGEQPTALLQTDGRGKPLQGIRRVSPGSSHVLAVRQDNTVAAWGSNASGQLGTGTATGINGLATVVTASGTPLGNIMTVATGDMHSVAVRHDGRVLSWGSGENGRLGDGTNVDSYYAVEVRTTSNLPFSLYR